MNEEEKWPDNAELIDGELHIRGSGSGYDEGVKIPREKMDEFRALIASGVEFRDAVRKFGVVAFVWYDWDSDFYN